MGSYHEQEAWDRRAAEEDQQEDGSGLHICKYCRQGGLHWEQVDGHWRLVSKKGEIHKCEKRPATTHVCPGTAPLRRL